MTEEKRHRRPCVSFDARDDSYCWLSNWFLWLWWRRLLLLLLLDVVDESEIHKILAIEFDCLKDLGIWWLFSLPYLSGSAFSSMTVNIIDPDDSPLLIPTAKLAGIAVPNFISSCLIWDMQFRGVFVPAMRLGHNTDLASMAYVSFWLMYTVASSTDDALEI